MSEFKAGDMARVVDSVELNCRDWPWWVAKMDQYVNDGKFYRVASVDSDGDVVLHQDDTTWIYPARCLEKVVEKEQSSSYNISVSGYQWDGNSYPNKAALTHAMVGEAYIKFTNSNRNPVFIQQLIDELKEIKEVCQKLI